MEGHQQIIDSLGRPVTKEKSSPDHAYQSAFNPFASPASPPGTSVRAAGEWRHDVIAGAANIPVTYPTPQQARSDSNATITTTVLHPVHVSQVTSTDGAKHGKRFQRLLRKIERASETAVIARLGEHGPEEEEEDIEMLFEFEFETVLWSIVQAERLSEQRQGRCGVFPIPGLLDVEDREILNGANILHLGRVRGEQTGQSWIPEPFANLYSECQALTCRKVRQKAGT